MYQENENREQELLFARILQETTSLARRQGNVLTRVQLEEAFDSFALSGAQKSEIENYLAAHRIGIDAPLDAEETLSEKERDYLAMYLGELEQLPQLSQEERDALAVRVIRGETEAHQALASSYLPLVVDIARLYAEQGVFLEDLIGEGNVALMDSIPLLSALEETDPVEPVLAQALMRAMEDLITRTANEKHRGQKEVAAVQEIADLAKNLSGEYRRPLTIDEFADETGKSREEILRAVHLTHDGIEGLDGSGQA